MFDEEFILKKLTQAVLASMVGGQMEIQNATRGTLFRGEIGEIAVRNSELHVKFNWLALAQGYPAAIKGWVKDESQSYAASLDIYTVSNIGPSGGGVGGDDRWCLASYFVGETVTIYPPNGSKLDPSKVIGFINATA